MKTDLSFRLPRDFWSDQEREREKMKKKILKKKKREREKKNVLETRKRNNERPSPLNERDRERARARERQRRSGLLLSDVVRKHNTVDRKTTVGRGLREAFSRSVFFFGFWFLVFPKGREERGRRGRAELPLVLFSFSRHFRF